MSTLKKYIALLAVSLAITVPAQAQEEVMNHLIAAREYLKADKEQLAKREIDSALMIAPKHALANAMMGELMYERGELLKSLLSFDKAILANPNDPELYIKRAELHEQLKNHRLYVLNDYNLAISLAPDSAGYVVKKAEYLARSVSPESSGPDYSAAATTMNRAIALDKKNPQYYYLRSRYLLGDEKMLAALADINKAITLAPGNDLYLAHRGYINFMISNYRAAYADYTRAIRVDSTNASYYAFRGHSNYNLEKYAKAYDDYSQAIDLIIAEIGGLKQRITVDNPLNKELRTVLLYRGMSLVQDGRPYDGCEDFERAYQMGETKARNYIKKYCY